MKDKVFIAWSGNNKVACRVKELLESHGYEGVVGGNEDNDSSRFTIGEVVIEQMEGCNQAILILQKKDKEEIVSSNLFFEMGFVLDRYGAKKVHAAKRESEEINIPTDIENFFIEPVPDMAEVNGEKVFDENLFAKGIVEYFLKRQQLTIGGSKMELISDYNKLLRYIKGKDKCSNYELAQYVLYFMQAAYLFDDVQNAQEQLDKMCCALGGNIQHELAVAVEICRGYFEVISEIRVVENTDKLYMKATAYHRYKRTVKRLLETCDTLTKENVREKDENGNYVRSLEEYIFGSLAKMFLYEHMSYACVLCSEDPELSKDKRESCYSKLISSANNALCEIERLSSNKNFLADGNGLFALCKAYIYRNLFFAYKGMEQNRENIDKAIETLDKSEASRDSLQVQYKNNQIDTKLKSYFMMEYHLLLVDRVKYLRSLSLTEYSEQIDDDLSCIVEYAKDLQKAQSQTKYNKKILAFYLQQANCNQDHQVTEKSFEELVEEVANNNDDELNNKNQKSDSTAVSV